MYVCVYVYAVPAGLPSPGSAQYQVTVTSTGCVNAVAFWPCLDMHGEDRWDLGPWASGGGGDTDNDSARDTHMEVSVGLYALPTHAHCISV